MNADADARYPTIRLLLSKAAMKTIILYLTFVLCAMLVIELHSVVAHPGHYHGDDAQAAVVRTWRYASGAVDLQASFVTANGSHVQLRKADGALVEIPVAQLSPSDRTWIDRRLAEIRRINQLATMPPRGPVMVSIEDDDEVLALADEATKTDEVAKAPTMHQAFTPFAAKLKLSWDNEFYYVGSNGMPDHPMMVGIRAWQQQVPIPQKYFGDNAWRIPLNPVPAAEPASAKNRFLRGAIALAVNGVPIFNPLNNRGDDAYLFGELDEYGGHCGRADDYHYHLAPVHLEKTVGKGKPIAYALDGYPIYGYEEADGSKVVGLDWLNGHKDAAGHYHYHATKTYPYLNGGFYGEVVERDGQVDPQPRAQSLREALPPLRGATITGFTSPKPNSYLLTYEIAGRSGTVAYTLAADGSGKFQFTDPAGNKTTENYTPRQRPPGGPGAAPPRRPGEMRPRRPDEPAPPPEPESRRPKSGDDSRRTLAQLNVTSSAIGPDEKLPREFTCDGAGISPPIRWSGAPTATKCFALSLWHTAPDQEKSYWIIYDIPADVTQLAKGSRNVGKLGLNDKRRAEYDPMCSKGPGVKTYQVTVYALSAEPRLEPGEATRTNLLAAIKELTLAEGTLTFRYERSVQD